MGSSGDACLEKGQGGGPQRGFKRLLIRISKTNARDAAIAKLRDGGRCVQR